MADELHVVLGAAGGTGGAIIAELQERGLRARAVSRSAMAVPEGVEHVSADVSDAGGAGEAVRGAAVVYHAANPPYDQWLGRFEGLNAAITSAVAAEGARLVYVDNLYMYGPVSGEMTEDTPVRATDRKGMLRASLAADLLAAHAAGELEVVIGRSPDYFGPGGRNSALGDVVFGPALEGKPIRWMGSPDVPHSVAYLPDMARAFVTLGTAPEAAGRVWHLPTIGAPTGREFVTALGAAVGTELKVSGTPRWVLRGIGVVRPIVREMAEIHYQWAAPFVSSDAAFQAAFGPQATTSLDDALAATVDWYRAAT